MGRKGKFAPQPVHAWELYGPLAEGYGAPEAAAGGGESDDDMPEPGTMSREEAGETFAELLIRHRLTGSLSAQQVCILAHWASRAGATGSCSQFAAPPGLQSGSYQRKLDSYLRDPDEEPFYHLRLPGYDLASASRAILVRESRPPHEVLAAEVEKDPQLLARTLAGARKAEWAQAYERHPAVAAAPAGEPVVPVALYVDGVPYSKKDGFVAFWVYSLVSMRRHLVAVVRKSETCQCGCRKYCTLHEIFRFLAWSFRALGEGVWPAARHDHLDWEPEDYARVEAAGSPLVRGALVMIKGDWAEFCGTFGFPTWSSSQHPCLFCHASAGGLGKVDSLSAVTFPHDLKTADQYEAACEAAEVWVSLTREDRNAIQDFLFYDKRKERRPEKLDAGTAGKIKRMLK